MAPQEDAGGDNVTMGVGCLMLLVIVVYTAYRIIIWLSTQTS